MLFTLTSLLFFSIIVAVPLSTSGRKIDASLGMYISGIAMNFSASVTSTFERFPLGLQEDLTESLVSRPPLAAEGVEQVHIQMGHDSSTVIITWSVPFEKAGSPCGVHFWAADGVETTKIFAPCSNNQPSNRTDAWLDTSLKVKFCIVSGLRERTT
jgi:hypothetical protein